MLRATSYSFKGLFSLDLLLAFLGTSSLSHKLFDPVNGGLGLLVLVGTL